MSQDSRIRGREEGSLPLTEGDSESVLIFGDAHTSRDYRWAGWARTVFHGVLATDLDQRGAATVDQLYFRLSLFMLAFNKDEIRVLLESARRSGIVERDDVIDAFGQAVSDEWSVSEKGAKLKRPRALSLPDLGHWAVKQQADLKTVFTSAKGVMITLFSYLALVSGAFDISHEALIGTMAGGFVILVVVLANGIQGDRRLRAAARSWPRFEKERKARFNFQLSYLRMAFIPVILLSLYVAGAIAILNLRVGIYAFFVILVSLLLYWRPVWRLRKAWSAPNLDRKRWSEEWKERKGEQTS